MPIFVTALSGCGGGGGGSGSGINIAPHDTCYYMVSSTPGCYGGAPGFKELRDHVALSTSTNSSITLVIDGGHTLANQIPVHDVATIHNAGVGGSLVLTMYDNGAEISQDISNGNINPDIISRSSGVCIVPGSTPPPFGLVCLDSTLFDEPNEPIVVLSAGDDNQQTALTFMLSRGLAIFSTVSLKASIDTGHYIYVYGLNEEGNDRHPDSSTCHELIKDYCIGAYFNVVSTVGGTLGTNGVYTSDNFHSGTPFSAPIVAVVLKLLKEADPTIENTKLIRIACVTATDLGPAGNDAEYGCGALNLAELFDELGRYVGTIQIAGLLSTNSFNTVPVNPNTNYASDKLLSDPGSQSQGFTFSYDEKTDTASICRNFLCAFYFDEDKSLQTGILLKKENAFVGIFAESKDNDFFGGAGSKGTRSDFGKTNYAKGAIGYKTNLSLYDIAVRFDITKGTAAGNGRIDHLEGVHNKISIKAERAIGTQEHISFFVANTNFAGEAGISGSDYDLSHSDFEVGIQFSTYF